jgi:hypothetical protein
MKHLLSVCALALASSAASCALEEPRPAVRRERPAATATATAAPGAAAAKAGEPWGGSAIDWKGASDGLAAAKALGRRALVVVTAEWCGHCKNYARVFSDPRVVEQARNFVMIRLDSDRDAAAARFSVDGGYVPRTFFLRPDGSIDADIHAARAQYRYFYDEHDPGPLLAAMSRALGH